CKYKNGKKEISCNHIIYEKHAEHIGKFAAVMIAPDDIALINEGSELRRKFIDGMLCQCNKQYFETLMNYQKILLQRNAWLKMYAQNTKNIDTTIIDYYNDILAPQGQFLFEMRKQFLKEFAPLLCKYYNLLAKEKESIDIEYQSDLYAHTLAYWLSEHLQHDMRYQRTLKGIHKDDFLLKINDLPIKNYGSQGQKKSFLFALKLAQHEYLKSQMNQRPLLLLDDVFEKLDQQRMEALLQIIQYPEFGQVILTDTHEHRVQEAFKGYNNNRLEFIRLH
ncbi:MAG: DNA replication and repair protein RecF, partial [Chitinophagaceae bacterium]|nr:DNA replication and repair protein RecF [Chitinophagaceae bacterium]